MRIVKSLRKCKLNNKGLTLVELICAIAILSLVGTAVVGIVLVATNSYQRSVREIEVQQEAQFAANLIGDLLKDAKEEPTGTNPITIKKGTDVYAIEYKADTRTIWISENGGAKQLMAEHVNGIPTITHARVEGVEVGDNTYTIGINVNRDGAPNGLTVFNSNNARNQEAGSAIAVGEVSATIIGPSEMVLEPNQSRTIECAVIGVTNQGINWSLSGNSDSNTAISGSSIFVAGGETSDTLYLTGNTVVTKSDGSPAGSTVIIVHVRRVTDMALTSQILSGSDKMGGAVYRIYANVSGMNLNKMATIETDYLSPYRVDWTHGATVNGVSSDWNTFYEVIGEHSGDGANENYFDIRLKNNLDVGQKIYVTATALHPKGKYPGGSNANKSGIQYASIIRTFSMEGEAHLYEWQPGNFYRGSEQNQGTLDEWTVKSLIGSQYGIDPNSLTVFKECRYREHGTANWIPANGTWILMGEGGNAIRISETCWMFACDKDYDIEIRFGARTWDGHKYYPTALGESAYTIKTGLEHAKIRFNVRTNMFNQSGIYGYGPATNPIKMSAGTNLYFNVNPDEKNKQGETGLRWERFNQSLIIKVQRLDGSTWKDVNLKYKQDQSDAEVRINVDDAAHMAEMDTSNKFFTFYRKGTYRILVGLGSETGGKQLDLKVYNQGNRSFDTWGNQNFHLWNEATGEAIFYIKVE